MNEENEVSFDDTKTAKKIFYLGDTQSINGLNFMVYDLDFEWHNNDNTGELIRLAKVSMVIVNVGSDSKRLAQADLRIYVGDSGIEYEQHEVSDFTGRTIMPYETVEGTACFIINKGIEKEVFVFEYKDYWAEQYSLSEKAESARWVLIEKDSCVIHKK